MWLWGCEFHEFVPAYSHMPWSDPPTQVVQMNRQLTVNCDYIVLFPVNGDCLSENPVNCDLNITRDTWFRLLSVNTLVWPMGVAEIYIRRIAQTVPILMIFSQIFRGACPPYTPSIKISLLYRSHSPSVTPPQKSMLRKFFRRACPRTSH